MRKIEINTWVYRLQSPTTVIEALEGLRRLIREDPIARAEFFQAAREGWRFGSFPGDRVTLVTWAALKEALKRSREALGVKKKSTLQVRLDPYRPIQTQVPRFSWTSPEGLVYQLFPWDLTERVRPKCSLAHPQYGQGTVLKLDGNTVTASFKGVGRKKLALKAARKMLLDKYATQPDRRVADARGWLESFLSSGEEVRGISRLEQEEELAGNPHFSEGIISEEVRGYLERAGYRVDPHNLGELASLVDSLSTREEKFKEGILKIDALRTRDGKAIAFRKPGLWETKVAPDAGQGSFAALVEAQMAHTALAELLEEDWSVQEVREHLSKLVRALSPADAKRLLGLLQEIAALRRLKVELHRAGSAPVRAVVYYDSSGEAVYAAPVYGY